MKGSSTVNPATETFGQARQGSVAAIIQVLNELFRRNVTLHQVAGRTRFVGRRRGTTTGTVFGFFASLFGHWTHYLLL